MILTAEELLLKYCNTKTNDYGTFFNDISEIECKKVMIKFAQLHVEAALKEALDSIPCLGSSTDIATYEEVEKEVLNAYPKELIK